MRRLMLMAWLALALLCAGHARADDFTLPGLDHDASSYTATLQRRFPAGGTPKARQAADQQAAAALGRKDWAAAAAALESRVALGDPGTQTWLDLASARLRQVPSDPKRALLAAWQAFGSASDAAAQVPPLLLMAEVLRALGRDDQAVQALEQAVGRAPDDDGIKRQLADAQRAAGMAVRRVGVEGEADPPRACIAFSVPPSRRSDFDPQDWVRLSPAVPGAAVTHEGDQICVSGLPSGATIRATLRAGLPAHPRDAAAALALAHDVTLVLAVPNRQPRILFDASRFVLPAGQSPTVTLTTINLSSVSLRLMRLSERSVAEFLRQNRLGSAIEQYQASSIAADIGSEVWNGKADVPAWQPNKAAHTALPLPPSLLTAGPGLYALVATPGDGTSGYDNGAVQMILRTDLAPTVWRGADGLTVQVRGYSDALPRAGVKLQLVAHDNDVLGEASTAADGVARFPAGLLHGDGPLAPAVLHAFGAGGDSAALDLNAAAFDLSDRGVSGAPHPGPLDGFVWLDRGIYRPGETVQVMALLRADSGQPADIPARVTVRRPNGQVFLQATPPRGADASVYLPVALSRAAAVGTWTVEVRADPQAPPIGTAQFRVDAFVPDRMAVDFGKLPSTVGVGEAASLPLTARFLYGAPAAGLTGHATATIGIDPSPFPDLVVQQFGAATQFGLEGEPFAPQRLQADLPATDAQGHTAYALTIGHPPDSTHPLKVDVLAEIAGPSGHGSRAAAALKLRTPGPLIGVTPLFAGGAVNAGEVAAFDIQALDADGKPVAVAARLRLVRERPDWHLVIRNRLASYETVYRDEPLESRDVALTPGRKLRYERALPFGRYRLDVSQAGGLAATSLHFRAGWTDTDSPDVPDRVDVSTARQGVAVGGTARVHIAPPFAGQATLAVLTDRVLGLRDIDVPAGGMDVDVPVTADWGPGAYVAVHVFRPAAGNSTRPGRAIGLVWVGIDPAPRTLAVTIATPDRVTPRARLAVPVQTQPGAWVSLAAVDEGVLRLTQFASPDPAAHFLGRRSLGLDIRDDWGRLIAPAEGQSTLLRQGGDEGSFVLPDVPQHTVTLFSPPLQADADGRLAIPLDLPDFNGQVRLMAVAWQGSRIGAASRDLVVRDALVAEPLLPRFLAPGDTTRLAVLLHNVDLPAGAASVRVTTEGPLAVVGGDTLTATLAGGAQMLVGTGLHATGAGRGVLHFDVSGPAGFHIQRSAAITVRPSRGAISTVAGSELAPGAEATLTPPLPLDSFVAGTATAQASFGAPVRYDADALLRALSDYPLSCLEQLTSQGLPLTLRPGASAAALATQVAAVLDRQRYDGGFGLWSAEGEAEPWLSAYAMDFLLRARAAGASVPDAAMADGLKYLATAVGDEGGDPAFYAAQPYRLYVLARAGQGRAGAARVLATQIDQLPTPLARAQLGAALALAHDAPRAEAAFRAALDAPARGWWPLDYGTSLRDQAAVALLLRESGLLPDRLARLVAGLPGADLDPANLSTQELAWTTAVAAVLGSSGGRDGQPPSIAIDGQAVSAAKGVVTVPLTSPVQARNEGSAAVWQSVSVRGVPLLAPAAARRQMRVTRQFLTSDGATLDLAHLTQNTEFVLLLEGRAEDGQEHRAMVLQGLPAGWEVVSRVSPGDAAAMPALGMLTETEAEPAADDRFAAVVDLTGEKPAFRVAVRLRAVTPGDYEIPGAEVSDMYRPVIFARQAANRVTVLPRD